MSRTLLRKLAPAAAIVLLMSVSISTGAAPRTLLQWLDRFGGSSEDWARGVATASDAVYVVGEGNPDGAISNNFIRRYGVDGRVGWTIGLEPGSGYLQLVDVAATDDGAYVLGSMRSSRGDDVLVAKVSSNGRVEWRARLGTSASDSATSLSVDASGIFVAGSTRGTFEGQTPRGGTDAFVARLDRDGDIVWVRQFGTESTDAANAVRARDGAVYAAGPTSGELSADGHAGTVDAYVRKFDADGKEIWTRQLGTSGVDSAFALDVDGEDIAVAGTTDGAMPGTRSLGATDAFVSLLSADGDRVWTHQFGGPDADAAMAVAVEGKEIIIGGSMAGGASHGSSDAVVWSFATSGALIDVLRFGTDARDLVADLDIGMGGRYVAGVASAAFSEDPWDAEEAFVGRIRSDPARASAADQPPLSGLNVLPRPIAVGAPGDGLFTADPVPQPPVTGPEPTTTTTPSPTPTDTATPSPSPDEPGGGNGNGHGGGGGGGGGDPTGPTGASGATGVTGPTEDPASALEGVLTSDPLGGIVDLLL